MRFLHSEDLSQAAAAAWREGRSPPAASLRICRDWREPADEVSLTVSYDCSGPSADPIVDAVIDGVEISLSDPVRLIPVSIPKPWGKELWFTGIEQRGECTVVAGSESLPLSSYLAAAPDRLCRRQPIVLLKILAPSAEPVAGDLYLEVHEHKQEVYVVTDVDRNAWPDGVGRIRFGTNQTLRATYPDDASFRAAFLQAAETCEALQDRQHAGEPDLDDAAADARRALSCFTSDQPLATGDVVTVPTGVPHGLFHGVQVVEFQSPTYERFIIAASQQVLTQNRWDSAAAIDFIALDNPPLSATESLGTGIERITGFEEFGVWRVVVRSKELCLSDKLPAKLPYAVVFCVSGELELTGCLRPLRLQAGEAGFVPAAATGGSLTAVAGDALCLIAAPGL